MRAADLEAEWRTAQDALSKADALELLARGFPHGVIMHMIGIARVRLCGQCYEPCEDGKWEFISPARIAAVGQSYTDEGLAPAEAAHPTLAVGTVMRAATPYTDWHYPWAVLAGDLIDLVCWNVGSAFASRCAAAEWLGCASRNEPTPIRRSPVDWLRHRCEGLVLLTQDRVRRYEILHECNDIVAVNDRHADELTAALAYPYPHKAVFVA